ncbi:hypothetical protein AKUA2003_12450 [Apilactobacillus kunkeei]|nr:hypothetical protein AKUA2003_12450 [Apilactobacillus kunkeei]CAI2803194.1 hypothetical protein AKUA2002_12470 [Apilactobacillus kunkeei]
MKNNVVIVSHKEIKMPDLEGYNPIQVGDTSQNFEGYLRDNTGNNISNKNPNYCELTAQYWLWKNDTSDVKGLVHYRRFFEDNLFNITNKAKLKHIIKIKDIDKILQTYDLILPKKRNYVIETSYSHYIHAHMKEGLDVTENVIKENFPEYLESYNKVLQRRKAHMFNMFISSSKIFDDYSSWLFNVLSIVEKNIDISEWNQSESRIFGYISELLMDVWLDQHKDLKYKELRVGFIGNQHWIKKISNFIYRKVKNRCK